MTRLLVTNAENEVVGRLIESLSTDHDVAISAWVEDPDRYEPVVADLDVVTGPGQQTHVLVSMPSEPDAAQRAIAVLDALGGDQHVLFIANELEESHRDVVVYIKNSGRPWTILHPIAMMDFSFAAFPPQISMGGVIFGISGRSQVGFVAASDVMAVLATIIDGEGHEGQEYVLTGPEALDMPTVVKQLSEVLGWNVDYVDLSEKELKDLMVQFGRQDPDMIERVVFTQLRAWRDGDADIVTNTVAEITGQQPESVEQWLARHRKDYPKSQSFASKAAGKLVRARYGSRIMS